MLLHLPTLTGSFSTFNNTTSQTNFIQWNYVKHISYTAVCVAMAYKIMCLCVCSICKVESKCQQTIQNGIQFNRNRFQYVSYRVLCELHALHGSIEIKIERLLSKMSSKSHGETDFGNVYWVSNFCQKNFFRWNWKLSSIFFIEKNFRNFSSFSKNEK